MAQKNDTLIASDAIFYNAADKTWQCQTCNKTGKYDWRKIIINHVNNKHNGPAKKRNKNQGPRILLPDDTAIKRLTLDS